MVPIPSNIELRNIIHMIMPQNSHNIIILIRTRTRNFGFFMCFHNNLISFSLLSRKSVSEDESLTKVSLNETMDNAVKHYASLFKLPSYTRVVLFQALICVGGSLLSTIVLSPSQKGLIDGALFGCSLLLANLLLDLAISKLILRHNPIYDLRRTAVLSLFCLILWFAFVLVGDVIALYAVESAWWMRFCLLGFSAVLIFRLIVFNASSDDDNGKLFFAAFVQPCSLLAPLLMLWVALGFSISAQLVLFLFFASVVGIVASYSFLHLVNQVGKNSLGIPSLKLFKAFLLNWIENLNGPFEQFLEELGEEQDVEVSLMKFASDKTKAVMIIPSVHPGPFKNIGSSILPALLKNAVEKEFGCVACAPHGLFGHELDLASQLQNQSIIRHVVEGVNFEAAAAKASPFTTVSNGVATACCQVFGNSAFLSITLSPSTTEDFPQELGVFVQQEAKKYGLECCIVVNAHNSINGFNNTNEALDSLKDAATKCLEKASSMKQLTFEVGASTLCLKEFRLQDGMGDGGITVTVVKVGDQKTAYVVVDGNNMISGLREKILSALHDLGVDAGEVYTTDTHSVNAVVLGRRGYHPVGEAIPHEKLIEYIKEATRTALTRLEHVKAGCRSIVIPRIKVIGEERLETLSLLTDKGLQRAKKIIGPICVGSGLLLMLFLLLV